MKRRLAAALLIVCACAVEGRRSQDGGSAAAPLRFAVPGRIERETASLPMKLVFVGQPRDALAGQTISNVLVALEDGTGRIMNGENVVAIGASGAAELGGTTTVPAINGIAAFTDLHLELAAGQYTLTATADDFASVTSEPFAVQPGEPSGLTSFFSTFDTFVIADGTSATLRLIVRDAWSNLVPNRAVTLHATGSAVLAPASDWKTDHAGTLAVTAAATVAGPSIISADLGNGVVMTTSIQFTPGAPDLETSSISASASPATLLSTVTVTVRDGRGNTVPNLTVSLESMGGTCHEFAPNADGVTNPQGLFAATLGCTRAETDTVVATIGAAGTLSTQVSFAPGGP